MSDTPSRTTTNTTRDEAESKAEVPRLEAEPTELETEPTPSATPTAEPPEPGEPPTAEPTETVKPPSAPTSEPSSNALPNTGSAEPAAATVVHVGQAGGTIPEPDHGLSGSATAALPPVSSMVEIASAPSAAVAGPAAEPPAAVAAQLTPVAVIPPFIAAPIRFVVGTVAAWITFLGLAPPTVGSTPVGPATPLRSVLELMYAGMRRADHVISKSLGLSSGFDVVNLTAAPLKLASFTGDVDDMESGPGVGSILLPGEKAHFEVTYYFFSSGRIQPEYASTTFPGVTAAPDTPTPNFAAILDAVAITGERTVVCRHNNGACGTVRPSTVNFMNKADTVLTVGPENPRLQSALIAAACADGAQGNCSFTSTAAPQAIWTPGHQVSSYTNNTSVAQTPSVQISDSQTASSNSTVSAKVSIKLGAIINAEITAQYSISFSRTHTFTQSLPVTVPSRTRVIITARQPAYLTTGDVTVKLGNTTYHLRGATFTSPDATGARATDYSYDESPLSVV